MAALILGFMIQKYFKPDPEKINGIYAQPGKYFYIKYYFILFVIVLQRIKNYIFGKDFIHDPKKLEKLQILSDHPKAIDAVFFQGVSHNGFYFCGGTERRQGAKINGLFYILIPDYGLLMSEKLPNTVLEADPETIWTSKTYSAEGITFTPLEPMKLWKVSFKGKMRCQHDAQKTFYVELNGTWTSDMDWFLFEVDLPSSVIAKAIAAEPWNKNLFRSLKDAHQTHYEQMGYFDGSVEIDGKIFQLKLDSFRDHSFGYKRDWLLMHRYIFHMVYLSNGVRICFGIVCQPCTTSNLKMGYMVDKNRRVQPITECDLSLYQHGENGLPPESIAFTFSVENVIYAIRIQYEHTSVHYVGNNREAKMHERFFTCDVNEIKGRGISEWHYNNSNSIN